MMGWLKWLWARPAVVFGFASVALGFILYRKWKADEVDTLKDAIAVSHAEKAVAVLDAKREQVELRVGRSEAEVRAVSKAIATNRRTIVEARTKAKDLPDDKILEAYKRLGYL